jgi:hypothetical protein
MRGKIWLLAAVLVAAISVAGIAQAGIGRSNHAGGINWSKLTVRPRVITAFNSSGLTYLQADCLPGEHVLSGGISVTGGVVTRSNPLYGGAGNDGLEDGWAAEVKTDPSANSQFADVIAACIGP